MSGFPRFNEPKPEELDEFELSESEMSLRDRRAAESAGEADDLLGKTSDEEDPREGGYDERRDMPERQDIARNAPDVGLTGPGPADYAGRANVGFRSAETHDIVDELEQEEQARQSNEEEL